MSTRDWTPEPWTYRDTQVLGDGILIAGFIGRNANAARIVQCVNACAGMDDPAKEIAALREALRAAEAECSEWRAEFATYGPDGQANDTIRAKLGLPKIGGGQ